MLHAYARTSCSAGVLLCFSTERSRNTQVVHNQLMSSVLLNNGLAMPLVGLGTWLNKPGEVRAAVYEAIRVGYRHIDAASIYNNQGEVGDGIHRAIMEGIVTREDVWVTSKLWNDAHAKEDVEPRLRETLAQLKLDYLDLYLVHWPATPIEGETLNPPYLDTWIAMEAIHSKGLAKTIGVCNMTTWKLEAMKSYTTIWPAVNQVEIHPMFRQHDLFAYCKAQGTHVTAFAPLGSADCAPFHCQNGESLMENEVVQRVAQETGKTAGQVLIRWALQNGTSVLPKSVITTKITENFQVFDWEISNEQFAALSSLKSQIRMFEGDIFVMSGGPYTSTTQFWDE